MASEFTVEPFGLEVSDDLLAELHDRLGRTRWPDDVEGSSWDDGVDLTYLRELVGYWLAGLILFLSFAALGSGPEVFLKVFATGLPSVAQAEPSAEPR